MYPYKGQYIYPPRPTKGVLTPGAPYVSELEKNPRWIAQAKLNGQNSVIRCKPNGEIEVWNRHAKRSRFELSDEQKKFLQTLARGGELVLNAEALDRKKTNRGQLYVYDILVSSGVWLVGSTYEERLTVLRFTLGGLRKKAPYEFVLQTSCPGVWVAKTLPQDWSAQFVRYQALDIFEGMMLKNLDGRLKPGLSEENNTTWCFRCRKNPNG